MILEASSSAMLDLAVTIGEGLGPLPRRLAFDVPPA
jgi:hypothetical protein